MTDMDLRSGIIDILETLWPKNKAKGLLAQARFMVENVRGRFDFGACERFLPGCWLLAPKVEDFFRSRYCFSIHPETIEVGDIPDDLGDLAGDRSHVFTAVPDFMKNAGFGMVYAIPSTMDGDLPLERLHRDIFDALSWTFFVYRDGRFNQTDPHVFFADWPGNRGRRSRGTPWDPETRQGLETLSAEMLEEMLLHELFYSGLVKTRLKKPLNDPYDIDCFLTNTAGECILPMEIKEKYPGRTAHDRFFGIDAGRVMMLLRLCIPNDANAIYLIREVDEITKRFRGWKYMTLSDIIITASWNLQAGGPGMGGQPTQTIRLPYSCFREFSADEIKGGDLLRPGGVYKEIKAMARQFNTALGRKGHSPSGQQQLV